MSSESSVSAEEFGPDVEEAITQTLPSGEIQRELRLFAFARHLKALARFADADPRSLKPIVGEWHRRASPNILTNFDMTWFEFVKAWPRIEYAAGTGPLDLALRRARARPLPPAALQYEDPKVQLLVALLAELQRMAGEKPFFLGCRSAGTLIGVGRTNANVMLGGLVVDGVSHLVSKGDKTKRKASEYLYMAPL